LLRNRNSRLGLSSSTVKEIASLEGDVSSMVPDFVQAALNEKFSLLGRNQTLVPGTSLKD